MTVHFVNLLDEVQRRSVRMAAEVEDMLAEALDAVWRFDEALSRRVIQRDTDVDQEEVQVEAEVINLLALYQPVGSDLRLLCSVLKVNNDLERVADCAVNIAERARHMDADTTAGALEDVKSMAPLVQQMLRDAVRAYGAQQASDAERVFSKEEAADALYGQIIRRTVSEAAESPQRMAAHLDVLSIAKNLERIADHATNIAEDVIYLSTGEIVRHRAR